MLFTKNFGKTNKSSKEFDSVNATFLIKGGFIDQSMAGVYTYLPLGLRVISKISQIVREEMDKVGVEMLMPSLAPIELWSKTGRDLTTDVLIKTAPANDLSKIKNDSSYILNPTHEEVITPIAKKFNISYKDLPFAIYQIQNKYRNEERPKSGLLRGREFLMKDLYSFHKDEKDLLNYYEKAKEAYFKVYERVGLKDDTYFVAASGGDFTEGFSHEFQVRCENGEDMIFWDSRTKVGFNREVAPALAPEPEQENKELPMQEMLTENITGVEELSNFLKTPPYKTVKTIIYETDKGFIAAAVRGDYEINEVKLKKTAKAQWLRLATEEQIKQLTGAEVGYAGIINLPASITLYMDEAIKYLKNFETGSNKTNYHLINVNWYRDLEKPEVFYDIKTAKEGDIYPETGKVYEVIRASEAGNIFPLNIKFSKAFEYFYTDENGSQKLVYMGSYGIGISRLMGILVENSHDEKGIIWPENVAPYKYHLVGLNLEEVEVKETAYHVYNKLVEKGVEVIFDDRENVSAGEKLSDADLIGIPYRLVISKKTGTKVEIKKRNENKTSDIEIDEFLSQVAK